MDGDGPGQRAISPVIGVVLLVAIVAVLAGGSAFAFFSLTEEREPQPDVVLETDLADDGISQQLVHEQGDRLDGGKVTLRGAADPEALAGTQLTAGGDAEFYAVESEIEVIYTGEHGTTYQLGTFQADQTVPEPDEGCDWVDSETNGGSDEVTIRGTVVNCNVETADNIYVENGGTVIGETTSDTKVVDAQDAAFYGSVTADGVVKLDDGTKVYGNATSDDEEVKVIQGSVVDGDVATSNDLVDVKSGGEVGGSITATDTVTVNDGTVGGSVDTDGEIKVQSGSTVGGGLTNGNAIVRAESSSSVSGDIVSDEEIRVDDGTVSGALATAGTVDLNEATVEGDVYVADADFKCTDSTIDGQDCSEYSPKDPDDY